jgi:Protein of unknown function (DUF3891)
MLVQVRDGETWLIRQEDHALVSGQMAHAWGAPGFEVVGPHHLVTIAAGLHDVGWQEVDDTPLLNPATHVPYNVFDYPTPAKVDFFPRGVDQAERVHPLVGLLDSLHYSTFEFLREEDEYQQLEAERQHRLRGQLAGRSLFAAGDEIDAKVRVQLEHIRLLDRLSLFICNLLPGSKALHLPDPEPGAADPWEPWLGYLQADLFERVPVTGPTRPIELRWDGAERLVLDPCPFREPVRVVLPYRRLAAERFADAAELREAWMTAEPGTHALLLTGP